MYLATFRTEENLTSGIITFAINLGVRILYRSEKTFAAMVTDHQKDLIERLLMHTTVIA